MANSFSMHSSRPCNCSGCILSLFWFCSLFFLSKLQTLIFSAILSFFFVNMFSHAFSQYFLVFGSLFLIKKAFFLTCKSFLKFIFVSVLCSFYQSFKLWSSLPSFHFLFVNMFSHAFSHFFLVFGSLIKKLSFSHAKTFFNFFLFLFSVFFLSKLQTLIFSAILSFFCLSICFLMLFSQYFLVFGYLFLIIKSFLSNMQKLS